MRLARDSQELPCDSLLRCLALKLSGNGNSVGRRCGGEACIARLRLKLRAPMVSLGLPVTSFRWLQTDMFRSCLGQESIPLMGWGM